MGINMTRITASILNKDYGLNEDLDNYLKQREGRRGYNGLPLEYLSIFSFWGYSLSAKKEAIDALKAALSDHATQGVPEKHLPELSDYN